MSKKIKLLFVTHLFYPAVGGVELHIKNLGEALVKKGYEVTVLTADAYSTEAFFMGDKRRMATRKETINGIKVERLGYRTFGRGILNWLRHLSYRFKYPFHEKIRFHSFGPRNRKFVDKILDYNPDIIYAAPLPTLNVHYAHKAAKILGKPLIVIPSYHIYDPGAFYNGIYFRIMQEADVVMAQSPMEKDFLARAGHIDHHKIIILPPLPLKENQLPPVQQDKQQTKQKYGITEKYVALYLGQQGYHKNVDAVLKGMKHVWQLRSDTALVIAGGTTENTAILKKLASQLEDTVQGKTYFIDNFPLEDKDAIYQMADMFISLSEKESFGIVFVEALNNGLPVIASKNCVARYILDEFQSGLLVDPTSPTQVAAAVMELLDNETIRNHYSRNARQKAMDAYHPKTTIAVWESVIAALVKQDGSPSLNQVLSKLNRPNHQDLETGNSDPDVQGRNT